MKYLGSFITYGPLPMRFQTSLEDRAMGRIEGWLKGTISQAGKAMLINSVLKLTADSYFDEHQNL